MGMSQEGITSAKRTFITLVVFTGALMIMGFDSADASDIDLEPDTEGIERTETEEEGENADPEEDEEKERPHKHNFVPLGDYGRIRLSDGSIVVGNIYSCTICGARVGNPVV